MRKFILIALLVSISKSYAQLEGQSFCEGVSTGSYFPLTIGSKKITWYNTSYLEKMKETKILHNRVYTVFEQVWENGASDLLYLREEKGKVYQWDEEKKQEFVRLEQVQLNFKWKVNEKEYKIVDTQGELITPFCFYKGLLVIETQWDKRTYRFYYLKGFGYVGATWDGKLISYVKPEIE